MKRILLSLLLLAAAGRATVLYTYAAANGSAGDTLTGTAAIGTSSEGYWTFQATVGTSLQVQNNATFGSNAARLVAGSWASAGNSKTSYANLSMSARIGTDSRHYQWLRWGGGYVAGNAHPSSGYTFDCWGGNCGIVKNDAIGINTALTTVAYSIANANDFTVMATAFGSNLALYVGGSLVCSATDATYTTGGIGFTDFIGTMYFDDLTVDDGVPSSNSTRTINLKNILRLKLSDLFETPLRAITQSQIIEQRNYFSKTEKGFNDALAMDIKAGKFTRTPTPTVTLTPDTSKVTPTATPTMNATEQAVVSGK